MKVYDITRDIMTTKPYGNDPVPKLKKIARFDKDGYNLSRIEMSLHAATHVDAPLHFLREGTDIPGMSPDVFVGPCTVLTVPAIDLDAMYFLPLQFRERLLLRGKGVLSESGIAYLFSRGVRLIGTDRESIGTYSDEKTIHVALLSYNIAIVENLELHGIQDGDYFLFAAPVKISGAEGAPCRALLTEM